LARLARGQPCAWALPPTATEEERLLAAGAETSEDKPPGRSVVVVHSPSFEMWDWLAAACQSRGFAAVWQRAASGLRARGAAGGIFDATDLGPGEQEALEKMVAGLHPAPVVALVSFPRVEDRRRALSAGAAAVLSKPLTAEDLFEEMDAPAADRRKS
jgi:CheY-like chemotaxis protein